MADVLLEPVAGIPTNTQLWPLTRCYRLQRENGAGKKVDRSRKQQGM